MAETLTPIQAIASAGLIDQKGLAPSANLFSVVSSYSNLSIVAAAQSAISSTNQEFVTVLKTVPSCLTGIVSANLRTTVPETLTSEFSFNNLIADVKRQADLVMTGGPAGLASLIPRIYSTCISSYDLRGTFQQMHEGSFDDFGITINSYTDVLTGGINSQFAALEQGLNNTSAREMLVQLSTFGTMFDVTKIDRIYDPKVLCQNLINQGFYLVNELLKAKGIPVSSLAVVDEKQLLAAMKTITGTELNAIITVTEFKCYGKIENLADVLDGTKLFSPKALIAAGGSLTSLANKFLNIGGSFKSFQELSKFFLGLKTTPTPQMSASKTLGTASTFENAKSNLSAGNGVFGNPTIYDYMGVITGEGYVDDITALIQTHNDIISSAQGQALRDAIINNDATALSSAIAALGHTSIISAGQTKFQSIFERLLRERKNSKSYYIDYSESLVAPDGIAGFVSNLHDYWNDERELRIGEFVRSITTNDIYGEAIKSCLDEGYNLAQLSKKNIPVYTKMNPVAFSRVVKTRPEC